MLALKASWGYSTIRRGSPVFESIVHGSCQLCLGSKMGLLTNVRKAVSKAANNA